MIAIETQTIAGGVTAPAGFRASGVACGIKANGKPDLSLVVSDTTASGMPPAWSSTAAAPTPAPARTVSATRVRWRA
jgi:glutamate N-acetyltransferase/amino-acid N-acetyltransferase